ncbi:hypothetical protein CRYUN_Cryun10bG0049200 [Craigia yunnanensis]
MQVGRYYYGFHFRIAKMQSGYDSIWVIVDHLTKSAHLLLVKKRFSMERLAKIYVTTL